MTNDIPDAVHPRLSFSLPVEVFSHTEHLAFELCRKGLARLSHPLSTVQTWLVVALASVTMVALVV